jgi:N-formylglutamate amidohydrolase
LIISIPHSGEEPPPEATWLQGLSRELLLDDIDRYVHELYAPAIQAEGLPALVTRVHRYAADLNRFPDDVDADSVQGSQEPSGKYSKGFHWVISTKGERIIRAPIPRRTHDELVRAYHDRFHEEFGRRLQALGRKHSRIFHLDCHSMPSVGTAAHRDNGETRADAVISDLHGKSASPRFKDLVVSAFVAQGFKVAYNWPYYGGRITERYGRPAKGHETIQIELSRALYMDERTYERLPGFQAVTARLQAAVSAIVAGL